MKVINIFTGKEPSHTELFMYVIDHEERLATANGKDLFFAETQDGKLILCDTCGNYTYVSNVYKKVEK